MSKAGKLSELIQDPRNANSHTERGSAMVSKSLSEFGFGRSVVVDKNNVIIGGNLTIEEAGQLGMEDAIIVESDGSKPIIHKRTDLDIDSPKGRGLAIADNRTAEVSLNFNLPVLQSLEEDGFIDLKDWWSDKELLAEFGIEPNEPKDAEPQIEKSEDLQKKWQVVQGDLFQVGEHRLLCGDSTLGEDVERLMGEEKVDIICADPPYGISIVAANVSVGGGEAYNIPFGGKKNKGSVGRAKPFGSKASRGSDGAAGVVDVGKYAPIIGDETTETAIKASRLYLGKYPKAIHFWWGANHYANELPPSSGWLIWDKEATGNFSDAELAWSNSQTAVRLFKHRWNGMLRESERGKRMHPSQKPSALAAWIYEKFGEEGDIVLDPFCGAGWTLVAAQNTKRKGRGIEMSPEYCAVILQRMQDAFPELKIKRIETAKTTTK